MDKNLDSKTVTAVFVVLVYLLAFICSSLTSAVDLLAQPRGTISVVRATALPLVNSEGNQVKIVLNYSMGNVSILGQRLNAVMGIYDRVNGTLIKLSSFPDGFILNNTAGTIQLASTLNDPRIQNISTVITLTNAEKSEKYSNDVRSDLDLRAILPTFLPPLDETLPPPASPHSSSPFADSQDKTSSNDDSTPNADDE
jgi:hypothetical protein